MHKRDPRYDVLFEPVKIGPVTAKNRFYQVPHCTGLGWLRPRMVAGLRGMKAEGGWGVVCTEYCSIHPASDDLPHPYASLWDQGDIRAHSLMTEQVHEHGGLAGAELWVGGARSTNLFTNEVTMDVASMPNSEGIPYQARAMNKADIRELRRWHRDAALRARDAGFDIVYVYATHHYLLAHFLSATTNTRTDEYGGSLENRVRLVRELIEETKDAVGDRCAVAVRFSADEGGGDDGVPVIGEHRDMLEMLAELPDLWDINIKDYSREMGVSRFIREGSLEAYMSYVKSITTKPVVTVGRFTSPDTMVSQVNRGIVDFIGAARPSIADPFLPKKGRPNRRDPRMYRLQHLLHRGQLRHTDPLHPEPDYQRGMAARLASRKDCRKGFGLHHPRGRRRAGGPGGDPGARSAWLPRDAGRGRTHARRPRKPRIRPARSR